MAYIECRICGAVREHSGMGCGPAVMEVCPACRRMEHSKAKNDKEKDVAYDAGKKVERERIRATVEGWRDEASLDFNKHIEVKSVDVARHILKGEMDMADRILALLDGEET